MDLRDSELKAFQIVREDGEPVYPIGAAYSAADAIDRYDALFPADLERVGDDGVRLGNGSIATAVEVELPRLDPPVSS